MSVKCPEVNNFAVFPLSLPYTILYEILPTRAGNVEIWLAIQIYGRSEKDLCQG